MTMPTWLSHNPVAWIASLNAVVDVAIAFGAPITPTEKIAIGLALGAISTLFVQSQVTSTAKLATLGVTITPGTAVMTPQTATVAPPPPPFVPMPPPIPVSVVPPAPPPVQGVP